MAQNKHANCSTIREVVMCLIDRLVNREKVVNIKTIFIGQKTYVEVTWVENDVPNETKV